MKIIVKIKPGARENRVKRLDEKNFVISVKEPPKEGRANEALIKILAQYFDMPKSGVRIVAGFTSKQKIVEIE